MDNYSIRIKNNQNWTNKRIVKNPLVKNMNINWVTQFIWIKEKRKL